MIDKSTDEGAVLCTSMPPNTLELLARLNPSENTRRGRVAIVFDMLCGKMVMVTMILLPPRFSLICSPTTPPFGRSVQLHPTTSLLHLHSFD